MMIEITLQRATQEDLEFAFAVKKAALGDYVAKTHGWDEAEQRASLTFCTINVESKIK